MNGRRVAAPLGLRVTTIQVRTSFTGASVMVGPGWGNSVRHASCTIADWILTRNVIACDCHSSEFDPREAGKVVDGPAARPLPPLALKTDQWKSGCREALRGGHPLR